MLKFLTLGAFAAALASAFALYGINTRTRAVAAKVEAKERRKEELISSIAVLKAERAFRSRPQVIEPHARKLGMRPVQGTQFKSQADVIAEHVR